MTVLIIVVALVAIVALYIFKTQRQLVNFDELANNAFKQIGVQLQSRWDAVSALVKMTEKYSKYEHDTLQDTIAARRSSTVTTAEELKSQESAFNGVLSRLIAVAEQYPELKASEMYGKTMDSINNYENNVRQSRMVYNDSVTKMNRMIRQWPSSFVASMLHFNLRDYLEEDAKKADYPPIS